MPQLLDDKFSGWMRMTSISVMIFLSNHFCISSVDIYVCVCGSELLLLHVKIIWDTCSPWMVTPLFYVLIWTPPLVLIYFLTAEIQTHNEGTARGNNCWFNISELFGIQWFDVSFFKVNQKADCNIFLVLIQLSNWGGTKSQKNFRRDQLAKNIFFFFLP